MEQEDAVWPPPPLNRAMLGWEAAEVTVAFRTEFRFVEGSVPNLRHGAVRLAPEGILLEGQAVMPYEHQLPVFVIGLLLPPLWMIAYFVMEYGLRHTELLSLSWDQVRRIVFANGEQLVCIVYETKNYKGKEKVYSLTFPLAKPEYEAFLECATLCVSEKVSKGKLRHWTSPINWAFGSTLLIICFGLFVALLFGSR